MVGEDDGTPEEVVKVRKSYAGQALKSVLQVAGLKKVVFALGGCYI